jgi:hypothetical protein
MNQELVDKLIADYPEQFIKVKRIDCGDGWYNLISRLCKVIQYRIYQLEAESYMKENAEIMVFKWLQIKEKFAGLRAYCEDSDDYIRGAINMAESMSYSLCEFCGEHGDYSKRGNYVSTVCEKHRVEYNYEIVKKKT